MSWWESFYDQTFAERMLAAPHPGEVELLVHCLRLKPGQRVFDQCCGTGRLSAPLTARGLQVVGVDQCADYIAAARSTAGTFVHGDAAEFVAEPCHAAFNAYSSFGYSPSDQENRRLLDRVHDSLLPGGRFLLDTVNAARVLREFQPRMERTDPDGFQLTRDSVIDWASGMLEQTWTYRWPDGRTETRRGDTRLYLPHALIELMSGFEVDQLLGNYAGDRFTLDSPRLILVASRA